MKYSDEELIARKLFNWPQKCDGPPDRQGNCIVCKQRYIHPKSWELLSKDGTIERHNTPLPWMSIDRLTVYLKEKYPFAYIESFYLEGWRVRVMPKTKPE